MAALRKRIVYLDQLHKAYLALTESYHSLRIRFIKFRVSQVNHVVTEADLRRNLEISRLCIISLLGSVIVCVGIEGEEEDL